MEQPEKQLSIIVPVYNEQDTLLKLLSKVLDAFSGMEETAELILVDDHSNDKTPDIIAAFVHQNHSMRVVALRHEKNKGKGAAIRLGLREAKGYYSIIQDADLEYNPKDIVRLLTFAETNNYPVVFGSRILNRKNRYSSYSFYLGGRLVSLIANLLYGLKLTDEPTCYKLIKTSLIQSIHLQCNRFEFCPEVTAKIAKAGYSIPELAIDYYPRTKKEGKKISWYDGIEAICVLFKQRFIK